MNDRHMVPLETTEGARTAASGSERVLLGLALLVLMGASVIIVSNLVGVDLEASASRSPQPSIEESATPEPTRSPAPRRQMILEPRATTGPVATPIPQPRDQTYWIRVEEDLAVRDRASLESAVRDTIPSGSAAQVYQPLEAPADGLGWLQLAYPRAGSWISTRSEGRDLVTSYLPERTVESAWVNQLVAGQSGFLATGAASGNWTEPRGTVLASSDGAEWSATIDRLRLWLPEVSVAWGPVGWLMFTGSGAEGDPPGINRSDNGRDWEELGVLPARYSSDCCFGLVGSDFGYVMSGPGSQFWYSADGVAWREMSDIPWGRGRWTQVTAIPDGFIAWGEQTPSGPIPAPTFQAAFSIDGRGWAVVGGGPTGGQPRAVAVGDRIVGMDADPTDGSTRLWAGLISDGVLTWRRAPGADIAFQQASVTGLVSDGERAYAFGWDRATGRPAAWVGDGNTWTREELPEAFEAAPGPAAAGPAGVVVVGTRPTMRGDNPIFWHRTSAGWQPERSPVFAVAADRPADCGALPTSALELQARDRVSLISCFGDAPITMRAWATSCDWCSPEPDGYLQPAWLGLNAANTLVLSLINEGLGYQFLEATLSPDRALQPEWLGAWVEVTGHFDDPATLTCTYTGTDQAWYAPGRWVVDECRRRFVLESVVVVDGP